MSFHTGTFQSIFSATIIISIFQSALWILLSIFGILTFRGDIPAPQYEENDFILTTIFVFYFQDGSWRYVPGYYDLEKVGLMKSVDLLSWMIAYLIISLAHLIITIGLHRCKKAPGRQMILIFRVWCAVTSIIAIMDAILCISFVKDYVNLTEYVEEKEFRDHITAAPMIMFIVAARGFALWIINIGFVIYFVLWLLRKPTFQGQRKIRHYQPTCGHDNYTFRNSLEQLANAETKRMAVDPYGVAKVREFPGHRRLSVGSFEAVTPFNQEEYYSTPSNKRIVSPLQKDLPKKEAQHACRACTSGYGAGNCCEMHKRWALNSELEAKLRGMKPDEAELEPQTLQDFSRDLKNFKQGDGRSKNRFGVPPKVPPPAAATCQNSNFY